MYCWRLWDWMSKWHVLLKIVGLDVKMRCTVEDCGIGCQNDMYCWRLGIGCQNDMHCGRLWDWMSKWHALWKVVGLDVKMTCTLEGCGIGHDWVPHNFTYLIRALSMLEQLGWHPGPDPTNSLYYAPVNVMPRGEVRVGNLGILMKDFSISLG